MLTFPELSSGIGFLLCFFLIVSLRDVELDNEIVDVGLTCSCKRRAFSSLKRFLWWEF